MFLTPISNAMGVATHKVARARALVEVPASDWVVMSLLTAARRPAPGRAASGPASADRGAHASGPDGGPDDDGGGFGDGFGDGFDEGPFATFGLAAGFATADGPGTETAHAAVEAAAGAIADAETLLRAGERRCAFLGMNFLCGVPLLVAFVVLPPL